MQPEIEKSRQRLLESSQPLDVEIRCSALQLLTNMRDRLALRADADTESLNEIVHQTRVDSKRLRALWRLLKPGLKTTDYSRLERLSKGLAKPLASSRDAQVMKETLDWVSADLTPDVRQRLLPGLVQVLGHVTVNEPALLQVVQTLLRLEQAIVAVDLSSMSKRHLHKGLKQTCRKGSSLAHEALQKHAMEPMHRWRKWVKLLLFQSGWLLDETAPKWISQVKALGSALGRLHDLDVLAVQMEEARACFWQEDLDQVSTGIKAARLNALGEIDVLTDEIYAKRARKRAKQLYRRWKH